MTVNQALAEDITHDTFMILIEQPENYRAERGSLLTFLCAVARHRVMNYLRRKHNSDIEFDEFENYDALEDETRGNPLADLLNQELAARIDACITTLPPLQREVIILREFQGLSYEEIANDYRSRTERGQNAPASRQTNFSQRACRLRPVAPK
jgi:RNA polymerase sigma-70 factor (ECF subfamily)